MLNAIKLSWLLELGERYCHFARTVNNSRANGLKARFLRVMMPIGAGDAGKINVHSFEGQILPKACHDSRMHRQESPRRQQMVTKRNGK